MQLSTVLHDSVGKSKSFLKDVRVEMSKVTWPSWDELKGQTIVVIVAVLMISAFIGLVDTILSSTIRFLITKLT
jgi:preprotein translocase subunit SecE